MRPLLLALLLAGCVDDTDVNEATIDSEIVAANKLAANKLAANKLAANKLAANKLAANSLESHDLMATADGRDVMSYIVGCALPTGASVTLTDPTGVAYSYPGWIGLAPSWASAPPTVSQRHWVSACVLARTNLYGVSVQISMRDVNNPALAVTPTETSTFNIPEAAFYGDLFAPVPVMYACANQRSQTREIPRANRFVPAHARRTAPPPSAASRSPATAARRTPTVDLRRVVAPQARSRRAPAAVRAIPRRSRSTWPSRPKMKRAEHRCPARVTD